MQIEYSIIIMKNTNNHKNDKFYKGDDIINIRDILFDSTEK